MKTLIRIYTLSDPRTNTVRYVGRTVNPLSRRLREHIRSAHKLKDRRKAEWLAELQAAGLKPIITEIDQVGLAEFQAAEKRWVAHYRSICDDLLNVKCGGDGGLGGHFVKWTAELDALLGKWSDSRVAELLGVTRKTVTYRRAQLGIPASFDRTNNKPPPAMGGHNRLVFAPEVVARFGKEPDYKIADELGVEKSVIARRRKALGIASYAKQTGNAGTFTKGMPHPRWSKRDGAKSASPTD